MAEKMSKPENLEKRKISITQFGEFAKKLGLPKAFAIFAIVAGAEGLFGTVKAYADETKDPQAKVAVASKDEYMKMFKAGIKMATDSNLIDSIEVSFEPVSGPSLDVRQTRPGDEIKPAEGPSAKQMKAAVGKGRSMPAPTKTSKTIVANK